MKRSLLSALSAMLTIVLIVGNLPFIAQSSPGNLAPPPPITPTPTSTPLSLAGMSQENPTPPTPGEFRDQVEQTRARQAMEAALAKYLRYWGPRYQVAPIEVAVEGEWAHGVAEWQSHTRTLSGPIHILAHRLPNGTWQALMPSTEGAYLQWLEAIPERLVPAGELNQLRAQAAEADALLRPQATPAVPPAEIRILLGKEELGEPVEPIPGLAQPTVTPTPSATLLGYASPIQVSEDWREYSNPVFGYSLRYPSSMFYREWSPAADLLHSVSFYMAQDSNRPLYQVPEIAVSIFDNPQRQTSKEWFLAHSDQLGTQAVEASAAIFRGATQPMTVTVDGLEGLTFKETFGSVNA